MTNLYKKYVRLSCRNASQLLVKRDNASLSFTENMRLLWHLRLCDPCTRFSRQVRLLDKLLTHSMQSGAVKSSPTLRPERRATMDAEIKKRLNT